VGNFYLTYEVLWTVFDPNTGHPEKTYSTKIKEEMRVACLLTQFLIESSKEYVKNRVSILASKDPVLYN
jgi:hypothetical protein